MSETAIIIHDVRSVQNVASIFRTAAAAGIGTIYLVGLTPTPVDRFGRQRKDFAKIALGSEHIVSWEHYKSIVSIFKKLKKEKFYIIGLEQSKNSIDYKKVKAKKKTAIVVGNEVKGLPKKVLDKCDVVAEIPMPGQKESLNVSIALAIALFRVWGI